MAMTHERAIARYRYWYRILLRFYTRPHRERFAESMEQTFTDLCRERADAGMKLTGFVLWVFVETSVGIIRDNGRSILTQNSNMTRIAIAAALALVAICIVVSQGDPEAMSLAVLSVLGMVAIAYTATNSHSAAYRAAVGLALAAALFLFWIIGAVGINGMAWAALATALVHMFVPVVVIIAGLNLVPISFSELILFTSMVNGPFAALYIASAWLFRKAAKKQLVALASLAG